MGNEAIEGSKMGSQLIMFVAIVGMALIAFLVGKNLMNTGLEQMESTVQSVNDSRFSDYNGKTVKGRAVKSAIDTFANDNVAIFIHTLAMEGKESEVLGQHAGWENDFPVSNVGAQNSYPADPDNEDAEGNPVQVAASQMWIINGQSVDTNVMNVTTKEDVLFVNYGAMLSTEGVFSFEGKVTFSRDFAISESGNVLYNADGSLLSKQGAAEYIANSASFNSQLIKNAAGKKSAA